MKMVLYNNKKIKYIEKINQLDYNFIIVERTKDYLKNTKEVKK